jgi:fibronectin type 3 domain-containing protein
MTRAPFGVGLIMLFASPALADQITLQPTALKAIAIAGDAGAPTRTIQNVGTTYEVRARDFASGAVRGNLVYLRFDLAPLGDVNIASANIRLTRTAGDTLVTSRFSMFGLENIPGNLAQNWTASSFAQGTEFDIGMFSDFVASTGMSPVNLTKVVDFSAQETVSGNVASLSSAGFVSFLQARVDAGGQATLMFTMPSQGAGNDKKMTFAFPGYTDPAQVVALDLSYSAAVLPGPTNLELADIAFSADPSLVLDWDVVDGAIAYNVYRRAAGQTTATLVATSAGPSYTDTDVELFGTYFYSVDAVTADRQSAPTAELEVRVIDSTLGIPEAPTGMQTTAAAPASITLAWDEVADALFYQVYRSTESDGEYSLLMNVATPEVTDATVQAFRSYYYRVKAVSAGGISRNSATLTVAPRFVDGPRPPRPRDLEASARALYSIDLSWDAAVHAQAYTVYRSTRPDTGYTFVGTTETNTLTDDFAVFPHITYYYAVYAVGTGGYSIPSKAAKVEALLKNHSQVEALKRAPVAVPTAEGMFLSWRLLGNDDASTSFTLYRDGHRLNHLPLSGATNFLDGEGSPTSKYEVRTAFGRFDSLIGEAATSLPHGYLSIPIQQPPPGVTPDGQTYGYSANDSSAADLDGDGTYEIILKWDPSNARDNSEAGYTGNVFIDAYKLDGTLLWRIDLGNNIRAGAHYTPFLVYDFDGDGRAEVVCRTADGTVDGLDMAIGNESADYRDSAGRVLSGPEFLTLFDGPTGAALHSIDYIPPRGNVIEWGDNFGNRSDRFNAGVAYLDGIRPSAVLARGYYVGQPNMGPGRTVVAAVDVIDGQLVSRWVFDTRVAGSAYIGQGNHQLASGDVDGDGKHEVALGSLVLDDDGSVLYSTGLGHGDAMHLGDLDPTHPGQELFSVKEDPAAPFHSVLTDAGSGEILWGVFNGRDTGRGLAADIDPSYAGSEAWGAANASVWSATGEVIGEVRPSINFAIWWDGDSLRELLDTTSVRKWDWTRGREVVLLDAVGSASNNGTKATPCLQADLLGDWREEVVLRSADNTELRIYTTSAVTEQRIPTLMHDSQYRVAVATQNSGYNQPPHPSFFIGHNMPAVAMPNVFVRPVPDFVGLRDSETGHYRTPVVVSLNVNHADGLRNEYKIDGKAWAAYKMPLLVTGHGAHTVKFRTLDADGNLLAETSESLTIGR